MSKLFLPDNSHRVTINGRTGSGKTQFAAHLLSRMPFNEQPWIIVNHKHDELFDSLPRVKPIGMNEKLPSEPGVYQIWPDPHDEDGLEQWLWRVWRKHRTGLVFDEGYMVPRNSGAFRTILTQGRSLRIPAFIITQRPSYVSRFAFSEANFYILFHLNDARDKKTVCEFTPDNSVWDLEQILPKYHARWYDNGNDFSCHIKPAPKVEEIKNVFDERLKPKRRWV